MTVRMTWATAGLSAGVMGRMVSMRLYGVAGVAEVTGGAGVAGVARVAGVAGVAIYDSLYISPINDVVDRRTGFFTDLASRQL